MQSCPHGSFRLSLPDHLRQPLVDPLPQRQYFAHGRIAAVQLLWLYLLNLRRRLGTFPHITENSFAGGKIPNFEGFPAHGGFQRPVQLPKSLSDDLAKEILLVDIVGVQRPPAVAGRFGNIVDGGLFEALLLKKLLCRRQHPLPVQRCHGFLLICAHRSIPPY